MTPNDKNFEEVCAIWLLVRANQPRPFIEEILRSKFKDVDFHEFPTLDSILEFTASFPDFDESFRILVGFAWFFLGTDIRVEELRTSLERAEAASDVTKEDLDHCDEFRSATRTVNDWVIARYPALEQ